MRFLPYAWARRSFVWQVILLLAFMVGLAACQLAVDEVSEQESPLQLSAIDRELCNAVGQEYERMRYRESTFQSVFSTPTSDDFIESFGASLRFQHGIEVTGISQSVIRGASSEFSERVMELQVQAQNTIDRGRGSAQLASNLNSTLAQMGQACLNAALPFADIPVSQSGDGQVSPSIRGTDANQSTCESFASLLDIHYDFGRDIVTGDPRSLGYHVEMLMAAVWGGHLDQRFPLLLAIGHSEGAEIPLIALIEQITDAVGEFRVLEGNTTLDEKQAQKSGLMAAGTVDMLTISAICKESGLPYPSAHRGIV